MPAIYRGAGDGTQTRGLIVGNDALYQLSYTRIFAANKYISIASNCKVTNANGDEYSQSVRSTDLLLHEQIRQRHPSLQLRRHCRTQRLHTNTLAE